MVDHGLELDTSREGKGSSLETGISKVLGTFVYIGALYLGDYPRDLPPSRIQYLDVIDMIERYVPFPRKV